MDINTRQVLGFFCFFLKQQRSVFKRVLLENLKCKKDQDGTAVYREGWGTWAPDGFAPDLVTFRPVLLQVKCTYETHGVTLK